MSKKEKVELSSTRKKRCQRKSTRTLQFSYELLLPPPPPHRHTVGRLRGNKKWPEIQIGAKWLFLFFFQGETIQQNIQQSNLVALQSSSTCALTGFFWLLSHMIDLKLTKVLEECLLYQTEWWIVEPLFLSLNNWGLNFLQNKCSQSSQIYLSPEKLRKVITFQAYKLLSDKMTKTILPNCQIAFLSIPVIYHSNLGKKTLLQYSCQLEIDHVTQKPKETCQSTCGGAISAMKNMQVCI